jgi:DNA-binding transcriptional MerR regulator
VPTDDLDIKTLCERAGVTPRTIHFYIQQGLLPPAGTVGPGARYTEGHLLRLRLIRLLQKEHLPLAEIAKRLKGFTDAQVGALLEERRQRKTPARGSALEYVRNVLQAAETPRLFEVHSTPATVARLASTRPEAATIEPSRSQWERFVLADGVELHVRRPLTRGEQRRLDQVLSAARQIFDDEAPG